MKEGAKAQFTLREITAFGTGFGLMIITCAYCVALFFKTGDIGNASAATFDSQLVPATSSIPSLDIGSSGARWRSIYLSQNMVIDGKVIWTTGAVTGYSNNSISMLKQGSVPVKYATSTAGTLQTITVTSTVLAELAGILPGDRVFMTPPPGLNDNLVFVGARTITDGMEVKLKDMRTSGSDLPSATNTWSYLVIR